VLFVSSSVEPHSATMSLRLPQGKLSPYQIPIVLIGTALFTTAKVHVHQSPSNKASRPRSRTASRTSTLVPPPLPLTYSGLDHVTVTHVHVPVTGSDPPQAASET
jgi:hypothetical protein